jgi:hypothetical protein
MKRVHNNDTVNTTLIEFMPRSKRKKFAKEEKGHRGLSEVSRESPSMYKLV